MAERSVSDRTTRTAGNGGVRVAVCMKGRMRELAVQHAGNEISNSKAKVYVGLRRTALNFKLGQVLK